MTVLAARRISEEARGPLTRAGIPCIVLPEAHLNNWQAVRALPEAQRLQIQAMIGDATLVDETLFSLLPNLGWIQGIAAGLSGGAQGLDWELVDRQGVVVTAARIHEQGIAELVLGTLLALSKNLPILRDRQAQHAFDRSLTPTLLQGKRALVVGAGNIGERCAKLLKAALEMHVVGISRSKKESPWLDESLGMDALDEELALADAVVLALPHTPETENLMDASRFARMKRSAYLINIGRGSAICEDALMEALQGQIAGAALDVFREEPLPKDSPLWDLPNLLITPHIAGYLSDYNERICEQFARNLPLYEAGEYAKMTGYANAKRY